MRYMCSDAVHGEYPCLGRSIPKPFACGASAPVTRGRSGLFMIASSSREPWLPRGQLVSARQDYAEYFTPARGSGKGEQTAIATCSAKSCARHNQGSTEFGRT